MQFHNIKINLIIEPDALTDDLLGEMHCTISGNTYTLIKEYYAAQVEEDSVPDKIMDILEYGDTGDSFAATDGDGILMIMYVMWELLDNAPCEITLTYPHIIWLFHDLSHLCYDISENDIYVDSDQETRAIQDSINLCVENDIPLPVGILAKHAQEFEERFGHPVRLLDTDYNPVKPYTFEALE